MSASALRMVRIAYCSRETARLLLRCTAASIAACLLSASCRHMDAHTISSSSPQNSVTIASRRPVRSKKRGRLMLGLAGSRRATPFPQGTNLHAVNRCGNYLKAKEAFLHFDINAVFAQLEGP